MSNAVWIAIGAVALVVLIWKILSPTLDRAVARAVKEEDASALIAFIREMAEGRQPDAFNHAIRRLWDDYKRPLAIPVIKALVQDHHDEHIAQYWIDQVRGVEPELAQKAFDQEFLRTYYRPELAAACGEAG